MVYSNYTKDIKAVKVYNTGNSLYNIPIAFASLWSTGSEDRAYKAIKDLGKGVLYATVGAPLDLGDFIGRRSGLRDWQEGNVIPIHKLNAKAEWEAYNTPTNQKL